ncbi:OMPdecase-domain-containing protein [Achaetomium macrosporum]|uniref:Orotidine 5'-phosphate decarboxylase n=1 Tax=Achaetomium macrosporum TaxID=79813 RepID=A0AAN7C1Y4_9PEZI|nr:OMPdecase-domain-containing protein [Achaetomium macrosporum]
MSDRHPTLAQSYAERAKTATHPLTRYLFRLMDLKASNLCLSADVTTARELLTLADKVGPSIVVLKTHYDLISGWDYNPHTGTGAKLAALARKHGFLIFEDRKFVDIGKTVQMQYTAGTARIIEWAHITNANIDAGKDMVRAMAEAAAQWKQRLPYEVRTSVTVGTPVSDQFDDGEEQAQAQCTQPGGDEKGEEARSRLEAKEQQHKDNANVDGRKGSIVSITTVTQSFEPADSPRLSKTTEEGDDDVFPGIEEAPLDRGLLLLAQMSTKGCLMTKDYTQACVEAAREHKGFVMGYVAQECLNSAPDDNFIHMTPGCKLPPPGEAENAQLEGDGLGQQYNTPSKLINVCGTDIVICDRKLPCTNCVSRNKQSACQYETGAPTAKQQRYNNGKPAATGNGTASIPTKATAFGYSHTGINTLDFLTSIEATDATTTTTTTTTNPASSSQPLPSALAVCTTPEAIATRDRYRSLLRQLPARTAIERLSAIYFTEFNWQYDMLDRDVFDSQLCEWYRQPFTLLSCGGPGPQALSVELRAFPAVVFQVCAVALLTLDDHEEDHGNGGGEGLEGLKYAGGMTFEDLAREYSESGMEILTVLGKRGMGLNTVLAGWVRASFLKYFGWVTESWHAVGSAIRDAQEIGLHQDSRDPKPASDSAEAVLENQWYIQRRRKCWMTLVVWDLHMACVLGRPTTTNLGMAPPSLPVDAPVPKDRSKTPVVPRCENEPPTPLTRELWTYHIIQPLKEVLELQKEGPCPKDFSRVDRLHNEVLHLDASMPAFFRLQNPDTRFDGLPQCYWINLARAILPQITTFELMALHRPYIFTRPKSRTEALKASLDMLHAQRLHFMALKPQMYKTFSLFFGTFDAIVLMAAIYILFPKEHPDLVQNALQHFQWAVERFEAMSQRNPLAKAALGVLHAIYPRLKRALGISCRAARAMLMPSSSSTSPASGRGSAGSTVPSLPADTPRTTTSTASFTNPSPSATALPCSNSSLNKATPASTTSGGTGDNNDFSHWTLPSDFDWASLQPIYATSDLVYHDLGGRFNFNTNSPWGEEGGGGGGCGTGIGAAGSGQAFCQFAGDFGDDSVWSLLNQYVPF